MACVPRVTAQSMRHAPNHAGAPIPGAAAVSFAPLGRALASDGGRTYLG